MIRVLLIDDDPGYAWLVVIALEGTAVVRRAATVAEGVALGLAERPDVVLCDLHLPDATGAAAIGAVADALPGTVIVALSGADGPGTAAALAAGAHDFVLKGGEVDGRLAALVSVAARRGADRRAGADAHAAAEPGRPTGEPDDRWQVLAEDAPVALCRMDAGGGCTWANRRFRHLLGLDEDAVHGNGWMAAVHPADRVAVIAHWRAGLLEGREFGTDARLRRPDGTLVHTHVTARPAGGTGDEPAGWTCVAEDHTERRLAERRLAAERAQLHDIVAASPSAILLKDLEDRVVLANPACEEIYGRGVDEIRGRVSSEVLAQDVRALDGSVLESGVSRQDEIVTAHADGTQHTWLAVRFPVRDADRIVTGVGVVSTDITERRRLEREVERQGQALLAAESQLRMVFETAPLGLGITDRSGRWVRVNPAIATLLGRRPGQILGTAMDAVVHPADRDFDADRLAMLLRGELDVYETEKRCLRLDGEELRVVFSISAVRVGSGAPDHLLVQLLDVTARRDLERRMRALDGTDPLTGLPDRHSFQSHVSRAAARVHRSGERVTLVLARILPPAGGEHPRAGDEALRRAADALRTRLRETDIVARVGTDTFGVLLTGVEAAAVDPLAAELTAAVERALPPGAASGVALGVARVEPGEGAPARALLAAEGALAGGAGT